MKVQGRTKAYFSPFEFDTASGILTRSGIRLRLETQPSRVLELLLNAPGEMVSREEIIATLWPGEIEGDFDRRLDKAVAKLRASLNDDPLNPRFVETIKGRGYRFIAEVTCAPAEPQGSGNEYVKAVDPPNPVTGDGLELRSGSTASPPAAPIAGSPVQTPIASHGPAIQADRRHRSKFGTFALAGAIMLVAFIVYFSTLLRRSESDAGTHDLELSRVTVSGDIVVGDISPDGKYVAYVRAISGRQSIWLNQLGTGRVLELMTLGVDECPGIDFSPDGNYLYFARKMPYVPAGELYRIPSLGGDASLVLDGISGAPAVSPDGRKIAFVRSTLTTHGIDSIVEADIDGANARVLVSYPAPGIHLNRLSWTANGQELVYPTQNRIMALPVNGGTPQMVPDTWVAVDDVWGLAPGDDLLVVGIKSALWRSQIYLIPRHGGTIRPITHDFSSYSEARATGDGKAALAVEKDVLTTLQTMIPGKESEPVTLSIANDGQDGVLGLSLTPDDGIVYVSYSDRKQALTLIDSEGATPRPIAEDVFSDPAVSPQGGRVAVARWSWGDQSNLLLVDLKTGRETRLTDGKQDVSPSFTPDGEWIVYASIQADKAVLMKVPVRGGTAARLTNYSADHPSVSPDGAWIACTYDAASKRGTVLAIIPIAGGSPKLTFALPATAAPSPLVWTPDGKSVSFINDVDGVSNIWQQPISGGNAVPVSHFTTGKIFNFQWSHRGRLVLSRGSEMTDAVLIKGIR